MSLSRNELRKLGELGLARGEGLPALMRAAALALARARGLDGEMSLRLRLFQTPEREGFEALEEHFARAEPDALGQLYEVLLEAGGRKRSGSYFTPGALALQVTRAALSARGDTLPASVCDPALGGGAFLLAAAEELARRGAGSRRAIVETRLYGADLSPLAVAVAEAALWLWCGEPDLDPTPLRERLLALDALERGWEQRLPGVGARGFELVIGNPPWVAYAGRAAQPLEPSVRRRLSESFRAFRGYPTLHGLFVERAAELAPNGVLALIVPSPLADLEGYRPVRRALGATHAPCEPLLELGQDAFEGVTQPCFALVASPGGGAEDGRPFRLVERQRARGAASEVQAPEVLTRIASLPSLPRELFGELGFQSAGDVAKTLFLRADAPDERHTLPLLEGKRVSEFRAAPPKLFLNPDPGALARARCRVRSREQYLRARFVVRQTAKYPIAALHDGLPFRNTLLAGFEHEEISPALAVALLNSTLYRALHLALRRDARQAVFPQVKVGHLRALPRPPHDPGAFRALEGLTRRASADSSVAGLRPELDGLVFGLFGLTSDERDAVRRFVLRCAPELARAGI
ncbi:MAG: N-6 DNA methylase [Polyangiaceae bacterium]|nr:N-6 DNA methylase [Polyangiaceae bacterium]